MLGPIIDSGCLLAGGLAGAYSAHLVPRRIKESLPPIFGVVTLCMGMTLVNKVASMPVVVASLLLGTLLGELVFAERLLSAAIKKTLLVTRRRRDMPVDEGTVLSLVPLVSAFCFGSMGIFGAVTEAITGKPDILLAKAVLDLFSGLLFGAVFGGIVGCIALPQFAILAFCYLCGNFCAPFMTPSLLGDFTACGGVIFAATGLRMCGIRMFPVINMLPALLLAPLFSLLWQHIFGV